MPANGRWDLIRRLKVNHNTVRYVLERDLYKFRKKKENRIRNFFSFLKNFILECKRMMSHCYCEI